MRKRLHGNLTVPIVMLVMCLIEAYALHAATLGIVLIGTMCVVAVIILIARVDMNRVALGAAYACAFTLTWNGWFVGPLRPGDVLVLVTLLCFGVAAARTSFRAPPWWIKQLVYALMLLALLIVLFPPDPNYLRHRLLLSAEGQPLPVLVVAVSITHVLVAAKFIIAVAATPVAFAAAAVVDRRAVHWLAVAFGTGAAMSGGVAFIDHTHLASLGQYITHLPNIGDRQVGFANHPNFLAAGLVLAVPFACWMCTSGKSWEKRIGLVSFVSLMLGVYASGSRGGAVCAVGAAVLAFALLPRTRPLLPVIVIGGLTLAAIVAVAVPSFGAQILRVTRLSGNATTTGSDIVRTEVGAQGVADFHHSPLFGIGLQASTDASQVYLQELAAGGLLLFVAMSVYMLGGAWAAFREIDRNPIAAAILGSIGATLALNIFEADLTDRFYYVPQAILVALLVVGKDDRERELHPVTHASDTTNRPSAGSPQPDALGAQT